MKSGRTTKLGGKQVAWALLGLLAICEFGCQTDPIVLAPNEQKTIDRKITEYPNGFLLRQFIVNLNSPTGFCFDDQGDVIVAEGGIRGTDPRIYGIVLTTGVRFDIYPVGQLRIPLINPGFRIYGPVGGIAYSHGQVFASHRDEHDMGVITAFGLDGSHHTVVAGLPAQGDFGVTDIVISNSATSNGRLYFGVGSATNSGVVGPDNWDEGWVANHPDFCDLPLRNLYGVGYRFDAHNPTANVFTPDSRVTGAYQPFGSSNDAVIPAAPFGKPTGAIYSVSPDGGDLQVEAWGVHDPVGIVINDNSGEVRFVDRGMEMRGTRPIYQDPDVVYKLIPGKTWYGFPDFSRTMDPISDPDYQLPDNRKYLLAGTGYSRVGFILDHQASNLLPGGTTRPYTGKPLAKFKSLAGAAKMAFVPANVPLNSIYPRDSMIVALWGDRAPFATSGTPLTVPYPGYRVVWVNPDGPDLSSAVEDMVFNVEGVPASQLNEGRSQALERPIDVKFGPDGNLYILDYGKTTMDGGVEKPSTYTGKIFVVAPVPTNKPATGMSP
jgi:glucose/arabinose dehydrogenase